MLEKLLKHGFTPVTPLIDRRTRYDQSIDETSSIRKSIFERFGADREVKLLQLLLDRIFEEKFDQHFPRRSGGESNVKGRFIPDEATSTFEPEVKSERSSVEQNHVKSEPATGKELPNQFPVKRLLRRIEKLTG